MALGSNDSKVRVYTIPNIKNMSRINTLIGCKGPIKGCWVAGETGLDVIAVDQIGMVCMWQQDYQRTELEFELDVRKRSVSSRKPHGTIKFCEITRYLDKTTIFLAINFTKRKTKGKETT